MDTVSPDQVLSLRERENKSSPRDRRPAAKDLSHHLSALSQRRRPSPLKELFQYIHPGMLSFAGGMADESGFSLINRNAESPVLSLGKIECHGS